MLTFAAGPPNNPPLAVDDSASTYEDTAVVIDVAGNDSDPDGNLDRTTTNSNCGGCTDPGTGTLLNDGDGRAVAYRKEKNVKKYECKTCGYVYDPEKGDDDNGVAPGTSFDDLPGDWCCPLCGVGKEDFEPMG